MPTGLAIASLAASRLAWSSNSCSDRRVRDAPAPETAFGFRASSAILSVSSDMPGIYGHVSMLRRNQLLHIAMTPNYFLTYRFSRVWITRSVVMFMSPHFRQRRSRTIRPGDCLVRLTRGSGSPQVPHCRPSPGNSNVRRSFNGRSLEAGMFAVVVDSKGRSGPPLPYTQRPTSGSYSTA